jgi:hypothetical protein
VYRYESKEHGQRSCKRVQVSLNHCVLRGKEGSTDMRTSKKPRTYLFERLVLLGHLGELLQVRRIRLLEVMYPCDTFRHGNALHLELGQSVSTVGDRYRSRSSGVPAQHSLGEQACPPRGDTSSPGLHTAAAEHSRFLLPSASSSSYEYDRDIKWRKSCWSHPSRESRTSPLTPGKLQFLLQRIPRLDSPAPSNTPATPAAAPPFFCLSIARLGIQAIKLPSKPVKRCRRAEEGAVAGRFWAGVVVRSSKRRRVEKARRRGRRGL